MLFETQVGNIDLGFWLVRLALVVFFLRRSKLSFYFKETLLYEELHIWVQLFLMELELHLITLRVQGLLLGPIFDFWLVFNGCIVEGLIDIEVGV